MRKMKFKVPDVRKMQSRRNDLKFEFPAGLVELTVEETKSIVAGESLSFWVGYVAGKIANLFS
jgi:hypothetical protein